jgi:hypothetical protein
MTDTTGIVERLREHIEAYERRDADVFIANEWIPDIDIHEIKATAALIESQQKEIERLANEVEHFGRLAFDDVGKNLPEAWKDIAASLTSQLEEARAKAIEECAEFTKEFLGLKFGWEESADIVAKAIRALGGQK